MSLELFVDTPQQRVSAPSVSVLCDARDWDPALSTNVFFDGITGTVFLMPGALEPDWYTSNTGIYTKIAPSYFTLSPTYTAGPPPNWQTPSVNSDGAQWLKFPDNTSGCTAITSSPVGSINQAMVWEFANVPTTGGQQIIGDGGYGASGDYTTGISFRWYTNNKVDVWQAGTLLGQYSLSGQIQAYGQTDGQQPSQSNPPFVQFIVIPCRERELLILSNTGGGVSVVLESIPEGTLDATITPAAPVWFAFPAGTDGQCRMAFCQFEPTGNAVSKRGFFSYDPTGSPPGSFQSYIDGSSPGTTSSTMTIADGLNPSTAYTNNTNGVCLNLALTGDGTYSPEAYGARGYTLPQYEDTWSGEAAFDISDYILSATLDVNDSISGSELRVKLRDPRAIIAEGAASYGGAGAGIHFQTDRAWQFWVDGVQIIEGMNERPKYSMKARIQTGAETSPGEMTYGDQTDTNRCETVEIVIRDLMRMADNHIFLNVIPLDGLSVTDAFTAVFDDIGLTNSVGGRGPDCSAGLSTTYISQAGNPTKHFNTQIESGDKGSMWIDRLIKTYCANYTFGLTPMNGWSQPYVLAQADLPSTPAVTLYDSAATAIADSATPDPTNLFRFCDFQMMEPEANDVYVQGYDFRTMRPILVHQLDSVNSDPTVAPDARTPAWRGQPLSYCWLDDSIGDMDTAEYAEGLIYARISVARGLVEIECDFQSPLYRGNLLKLQFLPGGGIPSPSTGEFTTPAVCRVRTASVNFIQTGADGGSISWSPTRYVLDFSTAATMLNAHGTDLVQIARDWSLRALSKNVQWGDANDKDIWTRPLIKQSEGT
jgi:hypothetical protein